MDPLSAVLGVLINSLQKLTIGHSARGLKNVSHPLSSPLILIASNLSLGI